MKYTYIIHCILLTYSAHSFTMDKAWEKSEGGSTGTIRSSSFILAPSPLPKFDELPPITDYDRKSSAILPISWCGKTFKNDGEMLALFPPAIAYYCTHNPDSLATKKLLSKSIKEFFYNSNSVRKYDIMTIIKCVYRSGGLSLSPQTGNIMKQIVLHIVHGRAVDVCDPRLIYNEADEINNKYTLITKLPTILQQTIMQTKDLYPIHELIKPLFKATLDINNKKKLNLHAIRLIVEEHNKNPSWYLRYISPQSTIRIAQEYTALICDQKPAPDHPYNPKEEIANIESIISRFPKALSLNFSAAHMTNTHMQALVYAAHWLENPEWQKVLILSPDISYNIKKVIKDCFQTTPTETLVARLEQEFAQTFGQLTYSHHELIKSICTRDIIIRTQLENIIDASYNKLKTNPNLARMSADTIVRGLTENLPSCPICFELFPHQFRNGKAGRAGTIAPCGHIFCYKCLSQLRPVPNTTPPTNRCPLCRGDITIVALAPKTQTSGEESLI